MAKKIVITSGKGGVGKTTLASNLASILGNAGRRTCVLDADFGLNNLDVSAGVENLVVYDVFDCITGKCRVKQALIQMPSSKNAYVLPSVSNINDNFITYADLQEIIKSVEDSFEYVLIDCPAGIGDGFSTAVSLADEAIVITTPSLSSLRDADKVLSKLKNYDLKDVSLIINRVRGDLILDGVMLSPYEIINALKVKLLGVIPEDDKILLSGAGYIPKTSDSGKAFKMIAQNLISGKEKIFNYEKKYSGIIGKIKRSIKKIV